LRSAQQVLATSGPHATIDEFAAVAEVSIATLYKHFGSKEGLIIAAQLDAQASWEAWMRETVSAVNDELEQLVLSFRLLLRIGETHPQSAQIAARSLVAGPIDFGLFTNGVGQRVMRLVATGAIKVDHVELRLQNVIAGLSAELARQFMTGKPNAAAADVAVEIAISLLGITPAKARKLAHAPLPPISA
jgi:AcrR family transcriptional regulator